MITDKSRYGHDAVLDLNCSDSVQVLRTEPMTLTEQEQKIVQKYLGIALLENSYIDANGHLMVVLSDGRTLDAGSARGLSGPVPYVGPNGNWFVEGVDTQVSARGLPGFTPYIGPNGNWFINGTDTGKKAVATDGETPYIGPNGNWWAGDRDLGVRAPSDQKLSELESRMNAFTKLPEGSTTGDAELIDGRVSRNGEVYANIGEHIRGETGNLSEEIDDVKTELGVSPNLANPHNFVKGYNWRPENNVQSASSNYFYMPLKVNEGDIISISNLTYIAAFGSDGQVVESAGVYNNAEDAGNHGPYTYTVPDGIVKIIISSRLIKIDKFMVNYGELLDYIPYNQFSRIAGIENELKRCDKDDMPTYYTEYLFGKIRTIQSISQSYDYVGDTFAFVTDYHAERNAGNSPLLLKKIAEETNVGFVVQNGDLIDGANDKAAMLNLMQDTINKFKTIPCNVFSVYGNHDKNSSGIATDHHFTDAEYYGIGLKNAEQAVDEIQTARMIYYVDNKVQKIRYFFLNSELSNNSTAVMCEWLAKELNSMPSGYGAVFFMHRSYQLDDSGNHTIETRCQMILDVIDAFNTGGEVNLANYTTLEKTVSFTTKQANTRAMILFSGHTHKDHILTTNGGLPICITTCDRVTNDDNVTRTKGTTDEQAFDIITLDLGGNKAYCTRIGSGSDRVIDLYSIS